MRNDNLFFAAFGELIERGCPAELAGEAATVVANDDPTLPNLGRTPQDQSVIQQALPYLQGERKPT
ncbi:hypothetical protein [Anabaena sp. 4-3]|uniref:hypothetical protein n=1 Tax=Anabaena sp. 4-3 TaxID=1811979 RepID=UPI00083318F7|nr:hypothetical protein [Anabaena sp. 4-3]